MYPNDPQILTGVSAATQFVQIALTPKRAGLVWTFFLLNVDLTIIQFKKSPHKSSLFRCESNLNEASCC